VRYPRGKRRARSIFGAFLYRRDSIRDFDVETIFLFPWALFFFHARPVEGTNYALFAMASMFTFLGILIAGYVWLYRKGALEWV